MNRIFIVVLLMISALISGCYKKQAMSEQETLNLLQTKLKVGDGEKKVMEFIKEQKWRFVYDDSRDAYQLVDPSDDHDPYSGKLIRIHMDKNKRILKFEVRMLYTGW